MMFQTALTALVFCTSVLALPAPHSRVLALLKNGQNAIALNNIFAMLDTESPCQHGERACVDGSLAQCVEGRFVLQLCPGTTTCAALPLINSAGTMVACTIPPILNVRLAVTGAADASASFSWGSFIDEAAMVGIDYDGYTGGGATDLQISFAFHDAKFARSG
ncbi:hypothetical protein C8R44DRAFT_973385 [Mycena epipterygia]|nr:hypothetical protein C8R44DRAFT_973385 [Mycena epipterygia]